MKFDDKEIKSIDIVFENCECYSVPREGIEYFSVNNLKTNLTLTRNNDAISEMVSCDNFDLHLNKKGLKVHGDPAWGEGKTLLKQRLEQNDISHVDIMFVDDSHLYVAIPWGEDDEYFNSCLKCKIEKDFAFIRAGFDIKTKQVVKGNFEPELGQIMFAPGRIHPITVTPLIMAVISLIRDDLKIQLWNKYQKELDPFENSEKYKNDTFTVEAYSWDEDYEQPFNFKWKDYELSWYKHFGRSMSANRNLSPEEANEMLEDCLDSIKRDFKVTDEEE